MTEALEIMNRVRWSEERFGIDYDLRQTALNSILGILNRLGRNELKVLALRAINENRV